MDRSCTRAGFGPIRPILVAMLLALGSFGASAQSGMPAVGIRPTAPSTLDAIAVFACYGVGPFVETIQVQRSGSLIEVRFVQDGLDFSPNPPHCAQAELGRLPAGQYTVVVSNQSPPFVPSIQRLPLTVAAVAVPIGNPALLALACALALLGWRRRAD